MYIVHIHYIIYTKVLAVLKTKEGDWRFIV